MLFTQIDGLCYRLQWAKQGLEHLFSFKQDLELAR